MQLRFSLLIVFDLVIKIIFKCVWANCGRQYHAHWMSDRHKDKNIVNDHLTINVDI